MNDITVTITDKNVRSYPIHKHSKWEVMYYLKGKGFLATLERNIDFMRGTIIIVPPNVYHGSVSKDGFTNISVCGDFNNLFMFDKIVALQDDSTDNGERLSRLIFENRYKNADYLSALCNAYAQFLLQNHKYENRLNVTINNIIDSVNKNFLDPEFKITLLLNKSGYATDYIRSEFKKTTSLSPIDFLLNIRISHAKKLFEIYGRNISVSVVAEASGFNDMVYFSKRFKQITGISPNEYKKKITK